MIINKAIDKWLNDHNITRDTLDEWNVEVTNSALVFPILTPYGHEVATVIRNFEIGQPKYDVNPRGCRIGMTVYGFHRAIKSIKEYNEAIIVEGPADAMALHAAGYENVVAAMGSHVTHTQAALCNLFADNLYVWMDGDMAGEEFAKHAASKLKQFRGKVMGVTVDNSDPSDLCADPEALEWFMNLMSEYAPDHSFISFDYASDLPAVAISRLDSLSEDDVLQYDEEEYD